MDFVAIDLETTGLDPRRDGIIEVGAVRYRGGQAEACLSRLCSCPQPLTLRVSRLTGLTAEDLAGAPPAGTVLAELAAFIDRDALVAHNAAFELAFLRAAGLDLPDQRVADTYELAKIVRPRASSYRLADLSPAADVRHRAMADAKSAGDLYLLLLAELSGFGRDELAALEELLSLDPALRESVRYALAASAGTRRTDRRAAAPSALDAAAAPPAAAPGTAQTDAPGLLGPAGPLARRLPAFEHRASQQEMARQVARALGQGMHLLVEAGTGTGKSLAYLLPAALFALGGGSRVVVSTHTVHLQEQLMDKDLPLLTSGFELPLKYSVLKGRGHYLCRQRHRAAQESAGPDRRQRAFLGRLLVWVGETATGDKAELSLNPPDEDDLWTLVSADGDSCPGQSCRWHGSGCFVQAARRSAQAAHIVVVNHSLLLSDIRTGNSILPPYRQLVLDEAHNLEEVATEHLGPSFAEGQVRHWLKHLAGRSGVGCEPLASAALVSMTQLFTACREEFGQGRDESGAVQVRLTPAARATPGWKAIVSLADLVCLRLKGLAEGLAALAQDTPDDEQAERIRAMAVPALGLAGSLEGVVKGAEGWVEWYEGDKAGGRLRAAPVDVGDILRTSLFDRLDSAVLTSATLAVEGEFAFMAGRLGLDRCERGRVAACGVGSPFNYRSQALLCLATDVPDPRLGDQGLARVAADFLVRAASLAGGRTMGLFTSRKLLRQVGEEAKRRLEPEGLLVLVQGVDGSRTRLLEEFRADQRTLLLGTSSFWEGIDLPGPALSCVVIVKLPFQPPTVPVVEARLEHLEAQGRSGFAHLTLPHAVLRFKQGFGRLIRTRQDRGVVVVLDPRLAGRTGYGRSFVRSLPGPTVLPGTREELLGAMDRWLRGEGIAGYGDED
ncbi:MAG: helicase C-terminal domain-containing protein [Bacillota bacterium]